MMITARESSADADSDIASNQLLRALRLVRLVRLLRLAKVGEYITMIEDYLRINLQVINLVKMVLFLVYLMHVLGCFWFFLANNSGEEVRRARALTGHATRPATPRRPTPPPPAPPKAEREGDRARKTTALDMSTARTVLRIYIIDVSESRYLEATPKFK